MLANYNCLKHMIFKPLTSLRTAISHSQLFAKDVRINGKDNFKILTARSILKYFRLFDYQVDVSIALKHTTLRGVSLVFFWCGSGVLHIAVCNLQSAKKSGDTR